MSSNLLIFHRIMVKIFFKRYWFVLLLAFIALDTAYTYWRNNQLPLDGDLVTIVLPDAKCVRVMNDPFGWGVITENAVYNAPNRFFAHAAMTVYWKSVPHLLQLFTDPINSLYTASALFNTGMQVALMFLLAAYIQMSVGAIRNRWGVWIAAGLLVPLFQTDGFCYQMGITNQAITYTFFYPLPMMLLLVLLWPFFKAAYRQEPLRVRPWQAVLLVLLMVVLAFNGPIAMAAVSVLLLGIAIYWLWRQWQQPAGTPRTLATGWLSGQAIGLLFVLGVLNLYSQYIGRNEAENTHTHTLWQLYQMLPGGLYVELIDKWGLSVLILLVVVNGQLIRWTLPRSVDRDRVLAIMRIVGLYAVVFIALIPFGGYRTYRPFLLRGDVVLPVVLGLFFAYGLSSYYLILHLRSRVRAGYLTVLVLFGAYFTYTDVTMLVPTDNDCERWALEQIQASPEPIVHLYVSCNVLSWGMMTDYNASDINAEMLKAWGVTKTKKLYFQQ